MYFEGILRIDPSQLTEIIRSKPTKAFARIAGLLTAGLSNPREEVETFGALAIMQQLYRVLRHLGINDVVQIAKDDLLIYEDTENRADDLKLALRQFAADHPSTTLNLFETLSMIVKDRSELLDILIEIRVNRRHQIGEYPISMKVNGMPSTLNSLTESMEVDSYTRPIFASQDAYETFVNGLADEFQAYLTRLKSACHDQMEIDEVSMSRTTNIIRPNKRMKKGDPDNFYLHDGDSQTGPVHRSCTHHDNSFFYAWAWSQLCYDNGIVVSNSTLVDAHGRSVLEIDEQGVKADAGTTFNSEAPFEVPASGVKQLHSDHEYQQEVTPEDSTVRSGEHDPGTGWLGGIGDWVSDSLSADGSLGSSCGGGDCGGGGCGGCGGD